MTDKDVKAADGPALWRAARAGSLDPMADEAPELDALSLAAYLDGQLNETAAARVEAALAADPERLELALAAREAGDAGSGVAPESLVSRARDLVPERAARTAFWQPHWLPASRRALVFAGITAGFVLISLAGFELGRTEVAYETEADRLLSGEFAPGGEDLL